jgi:serine/threonine protein kinase
LPDFLASLQAALVDRYRFERELGRGGMATVYLARDLRHGRLVAIKLLRQELVAALGPDRFLREIQVTAALQHPHILPLLDSGTIDDAGGSRPYYVMPYVQGESLRDHLVRERQLPVDEAVRITRDVAAALGYAHERGVVHRDIKPENILLSGGQAVVADFGIARALSAAGAERLTETGLALGTPHYMSPEQASGDPHVDGRADIYALGCVLYEMLAGEPPYTGPTAQAIIAKRMVEPIPRIRTVRESVPEELERAITRALAKTPADRFGTAPEFAEALSQSASAPLVPRPVGTGRYWRIAAVLIVLLVGGAATLRFWSRPSIPDISPSASLIAVLPFTPSGSDTALSRLGRDLVFTMSSELDGLGTIRVVDAHTVLAQAKEGGLYSPAEGAALACAEGRRRFPGDVKFVECQLWLMTTKAVDPDVPRAWRLADTLVQRAPENERGYQRLNSEMLVAATLARAGLKDSARRLATRSRGTSEVDPTRDLELAGAFVYTLIGDKDEALRSLKVYLAANPERRASLAKDPGWWFRDISTDPRFKQLVGQH